MFQRQGSTLNLSVIWSIYIWWPLSCVEHMQSLMVIPNWTAYNVGIRPFTALCAHPQGCTRATSLFFRSMEGP